MDNIKNYQWDRNAIEKQIKILSSIPRLFRGRTLNDDLDQLNNLIDLIDLNENKKPIPNEEFLPSTSWDYKDFYNEMKLFDLTLNSDLCSKLLEIIKIKSDMSIVAGEPLKNINNSDCLKMTELFFSSIDRELYNNFINLLEKNPYLFYFIENKKTNDEEEESCPQVGEFFFIYHNRMPYILVNIFNTVNDYITIIHECTHAIEMSHHNYRDLNDLMLLEVPSTILENIAIYFHQKNNFHKDQFELATIEKEKGQRLFCQILKETLDTYKFIDDNQLYKLSNEDIAKVLDKSKYLLCPSSNDYYFFIRYIIGEIVAEYVCHQFIEDQKNATELIKKILISKQKNKDMLSFYQNIGLDLNYICDDYIKRLNR